MNLPFSPTEESARKTKGAAVTAAGTVNDTVCNKNKADRGEEKKSQRVCQLSRSTILGASLHMQNTERGIKSETKKRKKREGGRGTEDVTDKYFRLEAAFILPDLLKCFEFVNPPV